MISIVRTLHFILCFSTFFIFSCSDNKPNPEDKAELPPPLEKKTEVSKKPAQPEPIVYVEELDQYQEYFKEQHETSFSHVSKKNWSSFTAGKDGILTKVMLFGKPNYTISAHYGSSMSGFIRADNPDSGPKYGEWSISREEIVNQLAVQGLTETDRGWITLQMRGEIPQQKGRLYFIVCDYIADNRGWFGAFAFAEANSYKRGRFWLHPEHDLVFRTYIGKTADQLEKEQRGEPLFDSDTASLVPDNVIPDAPKPMIELSNNFQPAPLVIDDSPEEISPVAESLYQPATQSPDDAFLEEPIISSQPEIIVEEAPVQSNSIENEQPQADNEETPEQPDTPKRSLFERFFKNKTE